MKKAAQKGSAALLHLAGDFLSTALRRKRRDFVCQAGSGKATWALGRIPLQSLLLLHSSAMMLTGAEGSWAQICNPGISILAALACSFSPVTRDGCAAHTPTKLLSAAIHTAHCHSPFLIQRQQSFISNRVFFTLE